MPAHQWLGLVLQGHNQIRYGRRVRLVAKRNRNVAKVSAAFRTLDRVAAEFPVEILGSQAQFFAQYRSGTFGRGAMDGSPC